MRVLILSPVLLSAACSSERFFEVEVTVPPDVQSRAIEDGRTVVVFGAEYGGDFVRDELAEIEDPSDEPLVLASFAGRGGEPLIDPDMAEPARLRAWLAAPGDGAFEPDADAAASDEVVREGSTKRKQPEPVALTIALPE